MFDVCEKMDLTQKDIFNKYKDLFPFHIVEFINDLGIIVTKASMPTHISGAIRKEGDRYRIYCNEEHQLTRIRFTLAHELGHFFYDKKYLENSEILDGNYGSVLFRKEYNHTSPDLFSMDIKANNFAANLLMPRDKFIELWQRQEQPQEKKSYKEIANFFNVSESAAIIHASNVMGTIF